MCSCYPGYTGYLCDTQIDYCQSRPCQNGATCSLSRPGTYTCTCPIGKSRFKNIKKFLLFKIKIKF
jgi:Notch-like protein